MLLRRLVVISVLTAGTNCSGGDSTSPETGSFGGQSGLPAGGIAYTAAATTFDGGCARFEVTLTGTTGIAVTTVMQSGCGPIVPKILGTPTFSRTTGVIQLPIALQDLGTGKYQPATWLMSWPDSLTQVTPAPPPALSMVYTTPDSTVATGAPTFPNARIWKFDTLLSATTGQLQRLDPSKTSRAKIVKITVGSTVTKFRVGFQVRAGVVDLIVPAIAPQDLPIEVYAAANIIANTPRMAGKFLKNIIAVWFVEGTSQSARQAAVDLVGGEVVGGLRLGGDGFYYVRIADDGTDVPLFQKINQLRALSQVELAETENLATKGSYLAPYDGTGWRTWKLRPEDGATGVALKNWALSAIQAPLAWGCEVGTSAPMIAVVDYGFPSVTEVWKNVLPGNPAVIPDSIHGIEVASILAAAGGDSVGMTGTMWHAGLRLYDTRFDPMGVAGVKSPTRNIAGRIYEAAIGGARIINLSTEIAGQMPGISADSQASGIARVLTRAVMRAERAGFHPLYVIAAGNNSRDAGLEAFPRIRDSIPNRTIVVASAGRQLTGSAFRFAATNNTGSRIDIAAPGDSVYVTSASGAIVLTGGTSFAAPHVAGVAGLLLSADPNLPTDSLKALILAGAAAGNRTSGGFPMLNAYEALRANAKRSGAPLCGNRVWLSGTQLLVQRGSTSEVLATPTGSVYSVSSQHGGHSVLFGSSAGGGVVRLVSGTWQITSLTPADTLTSGYSRSINGYSHMGDSTSTAQGGDYQPVLAKVAKDGFAWSLRYTFAAPNAHSGGASVCLVESDHYTTDSLHTPLGRMCDETEDVNALRSPWQPDLAMDQSRVSYSPMGDSLYVAIPYSSVHGYVLDPAWGNCTFGQSGPPSNTRCRTVQISRAIDSTVVYALKVTGGGGPQVAWTEPGRRIFWMGVAEAGAEVAYNAAAYSYTFGWSAWAPNLGVEAHNPGACALYYRPLPGGPSTPPVTVGDCTATTGTMSPSVATH